MSQTQNMMVLRRLKRGPLTALEALRELGVFRLAARVFDLRLAGWTIERNTVRLDNGKHIARYRLRS